MSQQTPAQEMADFLVALAEHLRTNPHLGMCDMGRGWLYVHTDEEDGRAAAGTLAAWFASVGATDLGVRLVVENRGYAAVHAYAADIGGHRRDLWGTVPGLQRLLVEGGVGRWNEGLRLTLAELEYFAEHGSLPEAGAR